MHVGNASTAVPFATCLIIHVSVKASLTNRRQQIGFSRAAPASRQSPADWRSRTQSANLQAMDWWVLRQLFSEPSGKFIERVT